MVLQFFWTLLYLLLIRKNYHQTEMDQITWYVTYYYQFYGLIREFEIIFFFRFGQETEALLIKFGSSKEIWQQSSWWSWVPTTNTIPCTWFNLTKTEQGRYFISKKLSKDFQFVIPIWSSSLLAPVKSSIVFTLVKLITSWIQNLIAPTLRATNMATLRWHVMFPKGSSPELLVRPKSVTKWPLASWTVASSLKSPSMMNLHQRKMIQLSRLLARLVLTISTPEWLLELMWQDGLTWTSGHQRLQGHSM